MRILGISCYYHDSAAALIVDGTIVAAAQEERFTRKKNESCFPHQAIRFCLQQQNLLLHDLDAVVFYEKPFVKLDRIIETHLSIDPISPRFFIDSFTEATKKTLFMRSHLEKSLHEIDADFDVQRLLFSEHHLSHAASAFYPSPFKESVILTMDGLGEWASVSVGFGNNTHLQIDREIHYPHSLGLFYSALTAFCGFKVNSGEYKLMGLAPYGVPRFKELFLNKLLHLRNDGSFELEQKYFNFKSTTTLYTRHLSHLLNCKPRVPESRIDSIYMDIAASTQAVLTEAVLNLTQAISKTYNTSALCLAGGVALNCVTNTQIQRQGLFTKIWIQPAAGDAGGAIGAALSAYYLHFKKNRSFSESRDSMSGAFLGTSYSDEKILATLQQKHLVFEKMASLELIEKTATALANGDTVGWFQGRMEFGPRSLGSRSILADPRPQDMQKKLNLQIKFRESFRPFAPMILKEKVSEWFEGSILDSPYMLFVDYLKKEKRYPEPETFMNSEERQHFLRSPIPAVTHLDHSARLQTVDAQTNPQVYELLLAFEKKTGVPILVNTSFNVRGEPIVESPAQAIDCFLATDLDILVIGSFWVEKKNNRHHTKQE